MIRVLLVDDHALVREALRLLIANQTDMTVVGDVGDAEASVEEAVRLKPDVIVLDLSMPGVSGLAAAKRMKARTPAAILSLTRYNDQAFVEELMANGGSGYVLKQSPSEVLLHGIRIAASGGQFVDPAVRPRHTERSSATPLPITQRENQILRLVASGHSNADIARMLEVSIESVERHKANAMGKLNLVRRTDVVKYAQDNGWFDVEPE